MPDYLFVYGTLRASCVPAELQGLVGSFVPLGPATTAGVLYDLGPYPGAVFGGDGQIAGEVFELPDDRRVLAALDDYEGFLPHDPQGSLYIRVRRTVALSDGRQLECWAYAYQDDVTGRQRILCGDWLRR
ncbi:MAG TPA: gamma-glutamylcyclotransferase family protein [Pirellulales bacterium]|nr:gamma-glutamylcyclotransferase family protein [Pirellulales bacterium]